MIQRQASGRDPAGRHPWAVFMTLYVLGVLVNMSASHQAPLVGRLGSAFRESAGVVGLALGAQFVAYLVAGAAAGSLVARVGTRNAAALGIVLIVVTCLANSIAPALPWLVGANLCQGLGMLILIVSAQVGVASLYDGVRQERALAIWATSPVVGLALGLLLSASVADGASWRNAFLFLATVATGIGIVAVAILPGHRFAAVPESGSVPMRLASETSVLRLGVALLLAVLTLNGSVNVWPTFLAGLHHVSVGTIAARSSVAMLAGVGGSLMVATVLGLGWSRWVILLGIAGPGVVSAAVVFSGVGGLDAGTAGMIVWNLAASGMTALVFATLPQAVKNSANLPAATGVLYQISSVGAICGAPVFLTLATLPQTGTALFCTVAVATLAMIFLFPKPPRMAGVVAA